MIQRMMVGAWPHQQRCFDRAIKNFFAGVDAQVVVSVTGSGKTRIMVELIQWAEHEGLKVAIYTNRRLLFDQLCEVFAECGVRFGRRASGHRPDLNKPVQICMVQTERSKVLDAESRELHAADLVIIDEAHINSQGAMLTIAKDHIEQGGKVIGFTATPVSIGHLYTTMVDGATASEARACGALLPAKVFAIEEPDNGKFITKVNVGKASGELRSQMRPAYCHSIFGRVLDHWLRLNPERLPTILFAPGVPESKWMAEELYKSGVRSAHIDAKGAWVDGHWNPGTWMRGEVIKRLEKGDIEIVCNRFVLREGIDAPSVAHGILATKFGGESTYLQAVGRILRNHHSLDKHVIIQDHGGNAHLFGSPNEDRVWELSDTDASREYVRRRRKEKGLDQEPYTCPECFMVRRSGGMCPRCGFECSQHVRRVLQHNGQLVEYRGPRYKKKPTGGEEMKKLWEHCFWRARKSRNKMTFRQTFALFAKESYERKGRTHRPEENWPFMPKRVWDEMKSVCDVELADLVGGDKARQKEEKDVFG